MSDLCYFCHAKCFDHKTQGELKRLNKDLRQKHHRRFDPECKLIKPCPNYTCTFLIYARDHVLCKKCYPYNKDYCGLCNGWLRPIVEIQSWKGSSGYMDACSQKADKAANESVSRKIVILKEQIMHIFKWYGSDHTVGFAKERQRLPQLVQQLITAIDLFRLHLNTHVIARDFNRNRHTS